MFWKKKSSAVPQKVDTRSVIQRLYADRRMPSPKTPNLASLQPKELEIYEACKYLQQFLNISMHGHWCVEQVYKTYASIGPIGTVDIRDKSICYAVWHGDCKVGAIEVKLYDRAWEESKRVTITADLYWADCFHAQQIRDFFLSVANIHKNIYDHKDDIISDIEREIDRAMSDALWDAFVFQKEGALDGHDLKLQVGSIDLRFDGDLGGYQAMIQRCKSNEVNIYDFERTQISRFNERLNR